MRIPIGSRETRAFALRVGLSLALGIPIPIWVYGNFPRQPYLEYGSCAYLLISAILGYFEKRKRRLGLYGLLVIAPLVAWVSLVSIGGYAGNGDPGFLALGFVLVICSAALAAASAITAFLGHYLRRLVRGGV
jgi:hypothetical protein